MKKEPKIGESWLMISCGKLFMYFRGRNNTIIEVSFKPYETWTHSFEAAIWTYGHKLKL